MLLNQYLEFVYLTKQLINNKLNLNLDIKLKIWNFYKKLIAVDIIKKFIFNYTYQCSECFTINWKFNLKDNHNNFYKTTACNNDISDITDTCCCEKLICLNNCYFNIKCKLCKKKLFNISLEHSTSDIGWNPIEGKSSINIKCYECSHINYIDLIMNNCIDDNEKYKILGKLMCNKNKYFIDNNKRIILN